MSTFSLPQARIPLAWVNVNGARVPANIDIEWMRSFSGMNDRIGGVSGASIAEIQLMIQALETVDALTRKVTDLTRKIKNLEAQLSVER